MNVIIDTGCANLLSLKCAIERLGYPVEISAEAAIIQQADKVFLPGVGTPLRICMVSCRCWPVLFWSRWGQS